MQILMAGCGNMGGAMLQSWLKMEDATFTVVKPTPNNLPNTVTHHSEVSALGDKRFDVIILAVKPQMMADVAPAYAPYLAEDGVVISIAAGVSLDTLAGYVPDAAIVRIMPNLPAHIAMGMNGLVANLETKAPQRERATRLAEATGEALWVPSEDSLDRLTAVSGSGPGYVFYIIEAYLDAAIGLGFTGEEARKLVFSTMAGTVEMARQSDKTAAELRASVTSKNGTTQAGLERLMREDTIKARLKETVSAAYNRARELSQDS